MVALTQALLNGLVLGLIYVAIAVGLTIVFGMLRLVNFAHGAFYAIGAYVGLVVAQQWGLGWAFLAAPVAVALFAVALDRFLLRPFYGKDVTSQILVTFGIALIVEETLRLIFGATTQQYPADHVAGNVGLAGTDPLSRLSLTVRGGRDRHARARLAVH